MSDTTATATLTPEFPRQYVDPDAHFGSWETAEKYYRDLVERPVESCEELEKWLLDMSELDAVFGQEGTSRHIDMTCATDDPVRKQRHLDFLQNINPKRKPWAFKLEVRFVELAKRFPLPPMRYELLERSARNAIELYREENIPLQTEDDELQQQFQETVGAMTCTYKNEELTLQQLGRFLEEPDRPVREETWRLGSDRFLQDCEKLDEIYDSMIERRDRIAGNAGCSGFAEYMFKAYERFDYSPDDCHAFRDAIEQVVVPAAGELARRRKAKLGLETLRPWDLAVDPDNRPPLRPFETPDELTAGCSRIFHKVNPELGSVFDTLREQDSLDLESRKGKAPGGYQATYEERRMPFIFMNAVGTESDVRTLLHEGGHAFHTWACRHEPLMAYRHAPIEFCEVASMGMECLSLPHVEEFYGDDANRARKRFFEEIIQFFPWMARVDGFQHYVYANVGDSMETRKDHWQELTKRFAPHIDYSGLETFDRHSWHRKLHFFEVPFYYVEYGIAQLGALQVWMNARQDREQAVALYRNGLALGGSRPLPELFEAAGCKFDFSEATLRPLVDAVMEEIDRG